MMIGFFERYAMRPVSALPRGLTFTRAIIAKALNGRDHDGAIAYSANRWGDANPSTRLLVTKANVGAGTVGSTFTGEGVAESEFWSLVAERSIIGQLTGLRRIPFTTATLQLVTGVSADWTGEGAGKPVVKPVFERQQGMARTKLSATAVFTKEMLTASQAELAIRDELTRAIAEAL